MKKKQRPMCLLLSFECTLFRDERLALCFFFNTPASAGSTP
jgi:hypothetical protein